MSNWLRSLSNYNKMIKLSHTLFALPFAGLATVLALVESKEEPNVLWQKVFWIGICMVSARSAAMGFNRYIDRDIDARNPRTALREIPAGKVSETNAIVFIVLSCLIFLAASWMIHFLCFVLAFPALFLVLFYSYSKRFTFLCHFILGASIGIAPLGAWIAILGSFSLIPILWSLGLLFHIAGFDILYSTQDSDFDRSQGLHSVPARFGIPFALLLAKVLHAISFAFLLYAGYTAHLGAYYYIFLAITGILFIAEHALVSPKDLSKVPIAFFHINASISGVLFLGILIEKLPQLIEKFSGKSP
ncbi:MAG: UbiA-like polyprenyltransferase [Spirochaetota bacterium]